MNDEINISNDRDTGTSLRGLPLIPGADVEGHAARSNHLVPAEDDTEGHVGRFKGVAPAEDDTEGHAARSGR